MQQAKSNGRKRETQQKRRFEVGIVGASDAIFSRMARIFQVTEYRNRYYNPVKIEPQMLGQRKQVEFIIMCSMNPTVINAWDKVLAKDGAKSRQMIYLTRAGAQRMGEYQLEAPVNPTKLIKLLDHYTIKELNFFPEFEIGSESAEMPELTASGLKILRSCQAHKNGNGLGDIRRRALIVDDSLAVRRQMQLEFELQNADLDVAETAEAAMTKISRQKYDIVFLDVVMPGMDGYSACKKIKRCPVNKDTPVVLLTSRAGSFDKIKGTLAGCDSYLVKPLNHNEFEHVYQKYVGQHPVANNNGEVVHVSK